MAPLSLLVFAVVQVGTLLSVSFAQPLYQSRDRVHAHPHHHAAHDHHAHVAPTAPLRVPAAAPVIDGFLPPLIGEATDGDLSPSTTVTSIDECASACLAAAGCISFNVAAPLPTSLCGIREECWEGNASSCPSVLSFACDGGTISGVLFASYGTPISSPPCGFKKGACDAPSSVDVVTAACVGKASCTIDVSLATFGGIDPCVGVVKFAAIALEGVGCSSAPPPAGSLQCTLSGYSRGYTFVDRANATYYQRVLPRNDTHITPAVAYALDVPASRSVTLAGSGILASGFSSTIAFLTNPQQAPVEDVLYPYRTRHNGSWVGGKIWGWDSFVPGSVASMLLMGAGGVLRWTEHAALRAILDEIVDGIADSVDANGFAFGYLENMTNAYHNGNNQLPSYVNSWFTHGMLEASSVRPDALAIARGTNSWWNNNTFLPSQFPMDGSDDHVGPAPHGYDPAHGTQSTAPFAVGHMLYWMNQAGIGHARMAMSALGTQADVDFLQNLFAEGWWLTQLIARNTSAIWLRKWFPDNYEVCVLEAYLDLYSLTGNSTYLSAVLGGYEMFRAGWMFPGGSISINENYLYPPHSLPLEWKGHWAPDSRPTGEMCPSAFWIKLAQRFHRLFPLEEEYVWELERAIINVGLAGQGAQGSGVRYFALLHNHKDPPKMVGTCCEGQSTRIFASIYEYVFSENAAGAGVSVDLYEAATIISPAASGGAVNVTIATSWPLDTHVSVFVTPTTSIAAGAWSLSLRIPLWAQAPVPITLDGSIVATGTPGSYVVLNNTAWAAGVTTNVSFSLTMHAEVHPYDGETQLPPYHRYAYTYGPFLLAAQAPVWDEGLDCIVINGSRVAGFDPLQPNEWLVAAAGTPDGALPSAFTLRGIDGVSFTPYYTIQDERFTAYPIIIAAAAESPLDIVPPVIVFRNASEGYHTFRIPNLVALQGGSVLLAFAEGRARDGFTPPSGDVADCWGEGASARDWMCTSKDIVLKRSTDGGRTWGASLLTLALANATHFYTNPQSLVDGSAVFLEYMRCATPPAGGDAFVACVAVIARSDDAGKTWGSRVDVPPVQRSAGGFGGVRLSSGRLLFSPPGSVATGALLSDDGGATWVWGDPPVGGGGENEVVELPGNELLMTVRHKNNTRLLFRSGDAGETWGASTVQGVTDPDCQASLLSVTSGAPHGSWLLFANPHTSGLLPYAEGRQNVTVQRSSDGGVTWAPVLLVDEGPSAYTSLAQLLPAGRGEGSCGVLYEESADLPVDFRSIRFVAFDCAVGG